MKIQPTQENLEVPVVLLKKLNGDWATAVVLCQIIYWSERKPDGWFAKSFAEWEDEILLSRHQVNRAVERLQAIHFGGKPLIEVCKRRSPEHSCAPTLHYRYNVSTFEAFVKSEVI